MFQNHGSNCEFVKRKVYQKLVKFYKNKHIYFLESAKLFLYIILLYFYKKKDNFIIIGYFRNNVNKVRPRYTNTDCRS